MAALALLARVIGADIPVVTTDRRTCLAGTVGAGVSYGTRVSVIATTRDVLVGAASSRQTGIKRTGISVITFQGACTQTDTSRAGVSSGARIVVITCHRIIGVLTSVQSVTGVIGAGIAIFTIKCGTGLAGAIGADVIYCTSAVIVAWRSVVAVLTAHNRVTPVISADIAVIAIGRAGTSSQPNNSSAPHQRRSTCGDALAGQHHRPNRD